nr:MAG: OncC [Betta papillomavirus 1]
MQFFRIENNEVTYLGESVEDSDLLCLRFFPVYESDNEEIVERHDVVLVFIPLWNGIAITFAPCLITVDNGSLS